MWEGSQPNGQVPPARKLVRPAADWLSRELRGLIDHTSPSSSLRWPVHACRRHPRQRFDNPASRYHPQQNCALTAMERGSV
jgi:hypothetical protein